MKRLIFMGSDGIALPALRWLRSEGRGEGEIAAVFTQPDRPSGRGKKLTPNAIKEWAQSEAIPVHQPERFGEAENELLREIGADLILVMAYGHILRRVTLDLPPLGVFNLHASLLPKYRGASPIQAALAAGEAETGVTLMRMVRRLDAGPMVDRQVFRIENLETGETAEGKMAEACVPLLRRNLSAMLAGSAPGEAQEDHAATYCRKLEKKDGGLDFSAPAGALARRINALYPWPGVTFAWGGLRVRVGLASAEGGASGLSPGTVLPSTGNGLRVATGDGVLVLLRLQRPGGRMLEAEEFLRGFAIPAGNQLPSEPMPTFFSAGPHPVA